MIHDNKSLHFKMKFYVDCHIRCTFLDIGVYLMTSIFKILHFYFTLFLIFIYKCLFIYY